MKLWVQVLLAIVLGAGFGLLLGPNSCYLQPIGTIFINLLRMLIVPLIFSSMVVGICSTDLKRLGRVGVKALALYLGCTVMALILGMALSSLCSFGTDLHFPLPLTQAAHKLPSFSELFINIVPVNPVKAFAEGNILQILIFAILFGVSLSALGNFGRPLISIFEIVAQSMFRMTGIVMKVAPVGVFALIAWATGSFGLEVLYPVLKFLGSYYVACIIYALIVYCPILMLLAKLSPIPFFKGLVEPLAMGASTCSSSATLPVTINCATKNLGMTQSFANFILPFGCTLNLNGSALFQSMGAIFIAQAYGIDLTVQHYIILAATIVLATFGTASIPSGGLIMLSIVFQSIGIPLEGIAILASVDRLRDMASTALNITGDAVCGVTLAKSEGELDLDRYYGQATEISMK